MSRAAEAEIKKVTPSYIQSLCLIGLAASVYLAASLTVELILVDFIHGNPHRTQSNAVFMMMMYPFLLAVITIIGVGLVFGISQYFQIVLVKAFLKSFGSLGRFFVLFALPITTFIAWYCYDYLTPTDFNLGINEGPDWKPYQHGITGARYLSTLSFQAAVTVFSVLYFEATLRRQYKKILISALLVGSIVFGSIAGQSKAINQYQYLGSR